MKLRMEVLHMSNNMIYSDYLGEMVIKGFYIKKRNGNFRHYTWNDDDLVYYDDDVDDLYYYEIPNNAIFSM